jgi:hypothetical protein
MDLMTLWVDDGSDGERVKKKPVLNQNPLPPAILRLAEVIAEIAQNEVLPEQTPDSAGPAANKVEKKSRNR